MLVVAFFIQWKEIAKKSYTSSPREIVAIENVIEIYSSKSPHSFYAPKLVLFYEFHLVFIEIEHLIIYLIYSYNYLIIYML